MEISKANAKEILQSEVTNLHEVIMEINNSSRQRDITFSRNVFLDLTHICANNCGYCIFRQSVDDVTNVLMDKKEVLNKVETAVKYNCTEANFTFGEDAQEEVQVQEALSKYNCETMVDYVYDLLKYILSNYDILPHTNMGIISADELHKLSQVNASMGLMLETTNKDLLKTIAHKHSPGKNPKKRLNYIREAGAQQIPFTTGLLIGIGETIDDRIESLFELRKIQDEYGHIQEIIIQNFTPKPGIAMENYPEVPLIDLIKLVMLAKIMFPDVSIQVPPNLNERLAPIFVLAGADDFGGISSVTVDCVNPDSKWPTVKELERDINSVNYNL
ncbi:MAG: 7,8-didemethyl-8-hydroxy-5-deazariboflavin synthase CofG, partial [Methanosphaera sp.]|nr:7,8-didemethyl-8-hydroxy-5-deazariboflavin synthase CofG [Methanosphaera sp.]